MLSRALAAIFVLVSVGGAIATVGYVPTYELQYFSGLTAIGLLLAMATLSLRGDAVHNIAALLVLAIVFSSYCLKLLLIVVDPASPVTFGLLPRIGINDPDVHAVSMKALGLALLGIASFCVGLICFSRLENLCQVREAESPSAETVGLGFWWPVWYAMLLLSICTAILSYEFDIGLMGSHVKKELPFHLRGVIFYSRLFFLTGVLLLLAFVAQQHKASSRFWWAIGLLVANGFADAIIRSSKSAILLPFLYIFFLMVVSGTSVRKRFMLFGVLTSAAFLLFLPFLSNLRVFRSAGHGLWDALILTFSSTPFVPVESLIRYVVWIIYRLPGIEMIIGIFGHSPLPSVVHWADILARYNGIAGYLTNDVLLVSVHQPHLAAPSYFGWWYLMFGTFGVVIGGGVLAVIVGMVWPLILRFRVPSMAVIRVFFLMLLFTVITEGTLDMLPKTVIAMIVTVAVIETGVRVACRFQKSMHDANK